MLHRKLFVDVTVALLIVLFVHTAISKFLDFKGFVHDLNNQPFPNSYTPFLSWFVPLLELAIVAGLFFGKSRSIALYASLILMVAFTVYTSLVLVDVFDYVPCSCGGVVSYLNWTQHFFFNLFFVAITAASILFMSNDTVSDITINGT